MLRIAFLLAAATYLAPSVMGASAADVVVPYVAPPSAVYAPRLISELRIGFSAQDPASPESGSANITGEVLSSKFWRTDDWTNLLIPRFHVGGSVNFSGSTSFGYAGLTWTYDIAPQWFVEGSFGGAVHNGDTSRIPIPNHNALGCSPLFRESGSVGYRINEQWSLMATVEHLSNAGFCAQNRGLTNIGARLGYQF